MDDKSLIKKVMSVHILIVLGLIAMGGLYEFGPESVLGKAEIFFDLDREKSIPTWFSVIMLGIVAAVTFIITAGEMILNRSHTVLWRRLGLIFLAMSLEEVIGIRERFITPLLRKEFELDGLLYYPWVLPVGILLIIFFYFYAGFIFHLPGNIRNLFLFGAAIYVAGAIGFEILGSFVMSSFGVADSQAFMVSVFVLCEESLEIFGVVVILYALVFYLNDTIASQISLKEVDFGRLFQQFRSGFMVDGAIAIVLMIFALIVIYTFDLNHNIGDDDKRDDDKVASVMPMQAPPLRTPIIFGDEMGYWGAEYLYLEDENELDIHIWWWVEESPVTDYVLQIDVSSDQADMITERTTIIQDAYFGEVTTSEMVPDFIYRHHQPISLPDDVDADSLCAYLSMHNAERETHLLTHDGESRLFLGCVKYNQITALQS